MDPECGREVNFMILGCADGICGGGQVTIINVFSGADEVLFGYGCTAWDYGGCTANALVEERRCTT